jgi:hypothetical protein
MTQPVHTAGPVEAHNPAAGCRNEGLYWQILESRKDEVGARKIIASGMAEGDARLLAAAYNAFDSTARKFGCNAVELAERMQEGELAELVETVDNLQFSLNGCRLIMTDKESRDLAAEIAESAKAILAKVKGGAA